MIFELCSRAAHIWRGAGKGDIKKLINLASNSKKYLTK